MKRTLIFIMVLVVLVGTIGAKVQTDLQRANLFGNIKYVTEITYSAKEYLGEWIQGDLKERILTRYTREGYLDVEYFYDADGMLETKVLYDYYDDKGNPTKSSYYAADGSLIWEWLYFFNATNLLSKVAVYEANGSLIMIALNSYDARGNRVEQVQFDAYDSIFWKILYSYDAEDILKEETSYRYDSSVYEKKLYSYDAKGNVAEMATYDADGSLKKKDFYAYEYDREANWLKRIVSREVTKLDKTYPEPQTITTRAITYY